MITKLVASLLLKIYKIPLDQFHGILPQFFGFPDIHLDYIPNLLTCLESIANNTPFKPYDPNFIDVQSAFAQSTKNLHELLELLKPKGLHYYLKDSLEQLKNFPKIPPGLQPIFDLARVMGQASRTENNNCFFKKLPTELMFHIVDKCTQNILLENKEEIIREEISRVH